MTQDNVLFRQRRVPGRLGAVGVSRLLALQVIQVGLFVVLVQPLWAAILGGLVGVLIILLVFARWQGRWITESALLWLRFRRRQGRVASQQEDQRLAALAELAPDLVIDEVPGPDATRLGMGSDGAGWFAVLEVEPADAGVDPPVPNAALARIAREAGLGGVVMQVVAHSAPAASGAVPVPGAGAGRQRRLWVAVRLDADLVTSSAVDDEEDRVDVPAVLAELTRRVRRALRRRGLSTQVLDEDGLIDALALSCDLASAGHAGKVHEQWRAWQSHRLAHRCFWLRRWPDADRSTALLARLAELPDGQVTVAFILEARAESTEVDLRCLVRVSAPPAQCDRLCDLAEGLTDQAGGQLYPMDGEHALAVYGSAPTGGGAR